MGDIWPYGGPLRYSQAQLAHYISLQTGRKPDADIMGAIGIAESDGDVHVINDTPSTGDYSVGAWQINYFRELYAGRTQLFGTPEQLVRGGVIPQAYAAVTIWRIQGYTAWSTFTSGAYKKYLSGASTGAEGQVPGDVTQYLNPPIGQGIDAWDNQIKQTAFLTHTNAQTALGYARAIDAA